MNWKTRWIYYDVVQTRKLTRLRSQIRRELKDSKDFPFNRTVSWAHRRKRIVFYRNRMPLCSHKFTVQLPNFHSWKNRFWQLSSHRLWRTSIIEHSLPCGTKLRCRLNFKIFSFFHSIVVFNFPRRRKIGISPALMRNTCWQTRVCPLRCLQSILRCARVAWGSVNW